MIKADISIVVGEFILLSETQSFSEISEANDYVAKLSEVYANREGFKMDIKYTR